MSFNAKRRKTRKLGKFTDGRPQFQEVGETFIRAVPQCFICDSLVSGRGTPLLMGSAPYSKVALPTKIGQLMGEGFMVIVTADDVLCRRCSSLIIRLDKLEVDMEVVRKALTGYLKMKYNLYDKVGCDYSQTDDKIGKEMLADTDSDDRYVFQALQGIELLYSDDEGIDSNADLKQEPFCSEASQSFDDPDVTGYKCVSCQYKTTSSQVFMEHLKIHSEEMYFKCSNCDQEFHSHFDIQEHIMSVHYSQSIEFQGAKITDHIDSKPPLTFYECNISKFQSTDKEVFDSHVLKHSKTPVYKCSVCFKKLKSKSLLKTHVCNNHVYSCSVCNIDFEDEGSLLEHYFEHRVSDDQDVQDEQEQVLINSEEQLKQDVQDETKNESSLLASDKKENYDGIEELLEQLHSENPVPIPEEVSEVISEDQSATKEMEVHKQTETNRNEIEKGHTEKKTKTEQGTSNFHTANFLLESAIFGKDEDDNLSADLDRNEGSETNDYISDPTSYLEDLHSGNEKKKEGEVESIDNSLENVSELNFLEKTDELKSDLAEKSNKEEIDEKTTSVPLKKRVYVCSVCGLRTHTESHMKRHFKSHVAVEKKIYECHICNKVLTTRSNLNRHLSNHENCPGIVTCKLCNEELTDRLHLKQHLEDQHSGPQHCTFCNMEFTSKRAFKEHELTHPERAVHQCDICHKRFLTQLRLRTHLENIHNDAKEGESDEKIYKCHICSKILTTYHNLKRHVRNHEKSSGSAKCSLCSEELTDKLHLRQHVEELHPETHQCPFCQKVFSNKKVCKTHELTHPERYVYKCDICEKMFLNETRLEKHKTMYHRDPHCRYCEKEIKDPMKLFNHERRHEMYKNKFPCQLCPKVFRTPSGLKYHMSVHTGKYSVYCEICGKGMHSEIVLEEHKATHTKEIRYTCELCGRNFTSNSTYRMHRKWHDDPLPYKCKICDRKFKHTSILAVHVRRAHTGERPYKCPHCPYTFSVSSTLHKHIILHTKKYPHNCSLCGKGFTTRTKIARHMARLHNDFEMLNAKPTPCQYKMVLKPSELPADADESAPKQEENEQSTSAPQLPPSELTDQKFEEVVEEQIVKAEQAIFLFQ